MNDKKIALALLQRITDLVSKLDEDYGYTLLFQAETHCNAIDTNQYQDCTEDYNVNIISFLKQVREALLALLKARDLITIG